MEAHRRTLQRASDGTLPESVDSTSEVDVSIVRDLVDNGYLTGIDFSSKDGLSYQELQITMSGREFLSTPERNEQPERATRDSAPNNLKLFISHSSADIEFVERLLELLQFSLKISSEEIRCTGVDGYRLPAGAATSEVLRSEVESSDAFIGVISRNSLESLYVLFELGARWGANRPMIPVLAPGTAASSIGGPLAEINALSGEESGQLHQLIDNLGTALGIGPESPAAYDKFLKAVLSTTTIRPSLADTSADSSSEATYLAIRLVCDLDGFMEACVAVAGDDGLYQGTTNPDGYRKAQVEAPDFPAPPQGAEVRLLAAKRVYEITSFPNEIASAGERIATAFRLADPPEYEEGWEERQYQYAQLGLRAEKISDALRVEYDLPKRDWGDWDPLRSLGSIVGSIEHQRRNRTSIAPPLATAGQGKAPGREEHLPLLKRLDDAEALAGEAKEIALGYKSLDQKNEKIRPIYETLERLAGQLSKYPALMQSIRDLNQYCVIMSQEDPHESCRDDIQRFHRTLLDEVTRVKSSVRSH